MRPMLNVCWAPMLGAFSVLFEEFHDSKARSTRPESKAVVHVGRDIMVSSCDMQRLSGLDPPTIAVLGGMAALAVLFANDCSPPRPNTSHRRDEGSDEP